MFSIKSFSTSKPTSSCRLRGWMLRILGEGCGLPLAAADAGCGVEAVEFCPGWWCVEWEAEEYAAGDCTPLEAADCRPPDSSESEWDAADAAARGVDGWLLLLAVVAAGIPCCCCCCCC